MRRRISNRKRLFVLGVSILVFIVILVFVIKEMNLLVRQIKEDFSKAAIVCTDISILSSSEVPDIIPVKDSDGIVLDSDLADTIKSQKKDVCIVTLEYIMYFNIDEKISNISMEIKNSEISDGEVYAFSNARMIEKTDNSYRISQTVLMEKACLRESFFENELPCSFKGQFDYKFSYLVEGREKNDTIAFSTAKKV